MSEKVTPRLKTKYAAEIVPAMQNEFAYKNVMQVPKLEKVVINFGLGEATQNPKVIERTVEQLTAIAGQKPIVTRSRKAIANFKLRENLPIGVKVTLRAERMFEFLDRLVAVALPRVRDFRGVSPKGFDGRGNFTMGLKEQIIFPEINYDQVDKVRGMNITMVTTAKTDAESRALLAHFGVPFRK
jgi:large subunit ribosomal protein L5